MTGRSRPGLAAAMFLALVACTAPPPTGGSPTTPSHQPSTPPTAVARMLRPSDCEFPDLRSPGGERLDLTGRWIGATVGAPLVVPGPTDWSGEWIRQHGDCLWAVLFSPAVEDPTLEPDAWVWYGRIGSAFVIDLVEVGVTDRETDPTSLDRAVRQWRIGFDREDEPFLCDSANPRCPSDLAPGDPYEVRLSDSDR